MKRPSFQFYPADWRNNAKLRRCSWAAKGAWADALGLLHDSDEYGVLRWPLREIAQAIGCPPQLLVELAKKGVIKGCDSGLCEPLVFAPMHAGKRGPEVVLVAAQEGPIWYSSRFVRDEYVRANRGLSTRFTASPTRSPTHRVGDEPSHREGDGASSTSTSSERQTHVANATEGLRPPACPFDEIVNLYHAEMPINPAVLALNDLRQGLIRARWRQVWEGRGKAGKPRDRADLLERFRQFFADAARSKFLTGQSRPTGDRPVFIADLEWLMRPQNFLKVLEGRYAGENE